MLDIKNALSVITVVLILAAYGPYLNDAFQNKIKPHPFTWLVWSVVNVIIFGWQLNEKAGLNAFVALSIGVMGIAALLIGLFSEGKPPVARMDSVFLLLALFTLTITLIARQPDLTVVLLPATNLLAFIPTLRKSWHNPFSESLAFYIINFVRYLFALLVLHAYTFTTILDPAVWLIVCAGFAIVLMIRRNQIGKV